MRKPEHLESLVSQGVCIRRYSAFIIPLHAHIMPYYHSVEFLEHFDTSDFGLQRFVLALKKAIQNPAYRSTIHRLSKPDVLEDIIAATPSLADDPIAIGKKFSVSLCKVSL